MNSEGLWSLIRLWRRVCKCGNSMPAQSEPDIKETAGRNPTRLIYLGSRNETPRLWESSYSDPRVSYAALSHRWGENPLRSEVNSGI
jgi:hypothetical protein